jgi:hypothetical protein
MDKKLTVSHDEILKNMDWFYKSVRNNDKLKLLLGFGISGKPAFAADETSYT